jgi:transcriptional regulator with XRE-family HTH domain
VASDDAPAEDAVASGIGAAVRMQRQAAGLSMRELAARAGMSQPFLSNLENSRAMPSIATLYKIAHALGVSPRDFLPDEPERTVMLTRAGEGPQRRVGDEETSAMSRFVAGGPGRMLEAHTYTVEPGDTLGDWFQHDGEDLIVVTEGRLAVDIGPGQRHELGAGDVLWHDGSLPHRWQHLGDDTTRLLLVTARAAPPADRAHGAGTPPDGRR